jgi:hypothetical protein
MPHVEIYGGTDPSYPMSAALAWAFTHPPGPGFPPRSTKPECLSGPSTDDLPALDAAGALDDAVRLVCHLPNGAQIVNEESGPGRYTFAVIDPSSDVVLDVVVAEEASELRYSGDVLRAQAPAWLSAACGVAYMHACTSWYASVDADGVRNRPSFDAGRPERAQS